MTNGVYLPRRKRSVEPLWHRRQISLDGLNRREGGTDGDCTAGQPKVAALLRSVQRAKRTGRVNWLADSHGLDDFDYLHHCFSQGIPSLFPSILTPGQFCKKKVASWQDVIWEQCVRPSHLNFCEGIVSAVGLRERVGSAEPWALAKATCCPLYFA